MTILNKEILLTQFDHIQSRKIKVIYHNLIGRKTVSNLFWSLRYGLLSWRHVFPGLSKQKFYESVSSLKSNFIMFANEEVLSKDNNLKLKQTIDQLFPEKNRQICQYCNINELIELLLLIIQALSEKSYGESSYLPLSASNYNRQLVHYWYQKNDTAFLINSVKNTLFDWLNSISELDATVFTSKLVGYNHPGYVNNVIADQLNIPIQYIDLIQLNNWCGLIKYICTNGGILATLINILMKKDILSSSTKKSLILLKKGYSINTILQLQKIKLSTFNEHILESAILLPFKKFNYDQFINSDLLHNLIKIEPSNIDKWDYKLAKKELKINFFIFRLSQIYLTKQKYEN